MLDTEKKTLASLKRAVKVLNADHEYVRLQAFLNLVEAINEGEGVHTLEMAEAIVTAMGCDADEKGFVNRELLLKRWVELDAAMDVDPVTKAKALAYAGRCRAFGAQVLSAADRDREYDSAIGMIGSALDTLRENQVGDFATDVEYHLAEVLYTAGRHAEADNLCEGWTDGEDGRATRWILLRARVNLAMGEHRTAKALFRRAHESMWRALTWQDKPLWSAYEDVSRELSGPRAAEPQQMVM